ncbi:MAG TPA: FAD-binding monooxygenase [Blastococcus sp.]|nr:FAD-binding monooxygenase [Blastococcus sp.]
MQFYLDGYRPGDPFVEQPHPSVADRADGLPEEVDVLIVGCGPAGMVLAAQLARFPEIRTAIVDRRDGPLAVGQADGVACRTVEMFEAFGLADQLVAEAYWVNEVGFWRPDPGDPVRITRTGRIQDVEDGLSEFPHVIVNQARMLAWLRDSMARSSSRLEPFYGLQAADVQVSPDGRSPVTVTLRRVQDGEDTGETATIRARYVVGCDGARSAVRTSIGQELVGDAMNQTWGVMDVLGVTDFPDIRLKAVIHSANGNLLIIPREGGYLVRLYIELDQVSDRDMLDDRDVTPEKLAAVANRILHPYSIDVRSVGWWSVYEIGQRLCAKFDDVPLEEMPGRLPQVFIAGDACHTHSAKAGQGMNVSMADAWNLGWKLAAVLRGTARPELLHTYSDERQEVAQELIEFDREFARMMSAKPKASPDDPDGVDPEAFQAHFAAEGRFTAGVATRYEPSMITGTGEHQHLAVGYPVGMRFHSAPVVRLADAKPVQLGHAARADGAWRLYVFADLADPASASASERSRARALFEHLAAEKSPLVRFTPPGADPDSVIDVRAVFQQGYRDLDVGRLPAVLLPRKGSFGLIDHEKAFCPDPKADDIFDLRGIDREQGAMVLVRPDQYVAAVLPLEAHEALTGFLSGVLLDAR